jgi:hypothetical protein
VEGVPRQRGGADPDQEGPSMLILDIDLTVVGGGHHR